MQPQTFNLIALIKELINKKKFIIAITILGTLVAIVFSLLRKKDYTATSSLIVKSSINIDRKQLYSDAAYQNKPYYAGNDEVDRVMTIFNTGNVLGRVIDSFQLQKVYNLKKKKDVIKRAANNYSVVRTENQDIEISFTDKSPIIAAHATNAAVQFAKEQYEEEFKDYTTQVIKNIDIKIGAINDSIKSYENQIDALRAQNGLYSDLLPVRGTATIANANQITTASKAHALEELKDLVSVKDQYTDDKSHYISIRNQYNDYIKNSKFDMFDIVGAAGVPTEPSSTGGAIITITSFVASMFLAILLVCINLFFKRIKAEL